MPKFSFKTLIAVTILLCVSTTYAQDNKVVVVPLGGEDPGECSVTSCDTDGATLSCPSGEFVVPCEASKVVFVSSISYDGNLGGLDDADAKCQALADVQPALNGKVFKAWLSNASETPDTRFQKSQVPYVLTDGTVIANDWVDLITSDVDGNYLLNPIAINEAGQPETGNVWSNTGADVEPVGGSNIDGACNDYMYAGSDLTLGNANIGRAGLVDFSWTDSDFVKSCATQRRLYCFEQ